MNWKKRFAFVVTLGFLATSLTLGSGLWTQTLPAGLDFRALAIDPTNTFALYTGTRGGVFKSTDMGANWVAINNGLTNTRALVLALDPTNTSTIYAGTDGGGGFKSRAVGLHISNSSDNGIYW